MTHDDILQKLREILEQDFQIPPARVTPEATFRGTLGMDSLDAVDLIYLLGKSFGLSTDVQAFSARHTVQSVVEHIAEMLEKKAANTGT